MGAGEGDTIKEKKKPRVRKSKSQQESAQIIDVGRSSDDEADDDLSLKIVQKSILRTCTSSANNIPPPPPPSSSKQVKKKRVKNKKTNKHDDDDFLLAQYVPKETDMTAEMDPPENIVLRQLLRGPRYFDPPDNSWGNCYNCGEGGHTAANCTSAKRKKPCFVCGSLEHNVKECTKGKDCFICKKTGHRAKDCPEKSRSQIAKICLKCGDSGHEMFSCTNEYSPDDLKEIQCYVCKCFGHLCCVDYGDEGPREVSCYRCGQLGHSGWECASLNAETSQATNTRTPSACYKCGEEGHIARKCTSSTKKEKRKSEYSSPGERNTYGNHIGVRSVPPDFGNARKRYKTQYGQASPSQPKPRGRGGWMTQDHGDYSNNHDWGSPKTPSRHRSNDRFHGGNGYKSNDRSHGGNGYKSNDGFHGGNAYKSYDRHHGGGNYNSSYHSNGRRFDYDTVVGSNGYQETFSASRFGKSSSYGKREYGW